MNRLVLIFLAVLCMGLVSCNKIEDKPVENNKVNEENTELDKAMEKVSDELKGAEISKDDIEQKDSTNMNKVKSESYKGEISQKDAPHSNKVEIGIVQNKDTGKRYTFSDLFNITDEFVNLIIDTSNQQLSDIQKQFTSNFDNAEWRSRLEDVSKGDSISYFIFNSDQQLEIYFDVPPAYGSFLKVVILEKTQWIEFVKDKSLF